MRVSIRSAHPCPVAANVALREECHGCSGRPRSSQRQLERGEVLALQGDTAHHLFALVSGWLRESVHDEEGRILSARIVGPGHVMGMGAIATHGTHGRRYHYTATIEALSAARVCVIGADRARDWFAAHPEQALDLAMSAARDLDRLRRELSSRSLPAEERVLGLIEELVAATGSDTARWTRLPATREQLGGVLGLTLETVSRSIHRLARRGVLEVRGRELRLLHPQPR